MKDIRISIRLNEDEHTQLKIFAIKNKTSIQQIMLEYIHDLLNKEHKNEKN